MCDEKSRTSKKHGGEKTPEAKLRDECRVARAEIKALRVILMALMDVLDEKSTVVREVVVQRLIEELEASLNPERDTQQDLVEAEVLSRMASSIAIAGRIIPKKRD